MTQEKPYTFQEIIRTLDDFWSAKGCLLVAPYDMEMGAGTFHPDTFLRSLGPEPWNAAHVQPSRRPTDGRYGENPNRGQRFHQYQVVMKPFPEDFQSLTIASLAALGLHESENDIRFVEDNWESPTLGAWGLGWEVWVNGMECIQYTYFQQAGGLPCKPYMGELAYGLERLAMYVQNKNSMYDIIYGYAPDGREIKYGEVYLQNEQEQSQFNFEVADTEWLFAQFDALEKQCQSVISQSLALPAYELVLRASHVFNLLDARGAISVTERQRFILRVRTMAKSTAETFVAKRESMGFPLLKETSNEC